MFGYVLPCKPEMKVREWQAYRAYYCGLCKQLAREYGLLARMLLNYDLVLLAMLADGLADTPGCARPERCIAGPLNRRPVCAATPGLSLAADALVLTAFYKLDDDVADERFFRRLRAGAMRFLMRGMHRRAAARRPELDDTLRQQTFLQRELEARGCASADEAADPTAHMTAALFAAAAPAGVHTRALARMGLCIGKILYYLDAAEDFEKDARENAYNVFLYQGLTQAQAAQEAARLCRLCAGEAALSYNLLDVRACRPILDNIVFLGIPLSISRAGQKRSRANKNEEFPIH